MKLFKTKLVRLKTESYTNKVYVQARVSRNPWDYKTVGTLFTSDKDYINRLAALRKQARKVALTSLELGDNEDA